MFQKYRSRLTKPEAALVKAMLKRGDRQSDIASYFRTNPGRISEINTGKSFPDVALADASLLPAADARDARREI